MAALISTYSGYIALSFLPPLVWLLFWLQEDRRHPEPKHLILLTFVAGIAAAVLAASSELVLFGRPPLLSGLAHRLAPALLALPGLVLGGVALIEEYLKYAAVKFAVLSRREFDEPVDAMVYMVTAALGFAAVENVLFLTPVFGGGFVGGVELTISRFWGANLLHAFSSAIVGYAIARHHWSPWRKHAVAAGVITASVLHALFNSLILTKDTLPASFLLLVVLLLIMAVVVFADFERLKKKSPISTNS